MIDIDIGFCERVSHCFFGDYSEMLGITHNFSRCQVFYAPEDCIKKFLDVFFFYA